MIWRVLMSGQHGKELVWTPYNPLNPHGKIYLGNGEQPDLVSGPVPSFYCTGQPVGRQKVTGISCVVLQKCMVGMEFLAGIIRYL